VITSHAIASYTTTSLMTVQVEVRRGSRCGYRQRSRVYVDDVGIAALGEHPYRSRSRRAALAYRLLGSTVITPRAATRKTALALASLTRAAWAD
jgi:hypothetical protein